MAEKLDNRANFSQKVHVMKNKLSATDEFLLQEIGEKLTRVRLEKNMTQAQLAESAGVSLRTLSRIERGNGASLMSAFIRVCRALGLVDRLVAVVPDPVPSPMEQLKMHGRQRRRASGKRAASAEYRYPERQDTGALLLAEDPPPSKWKWGDEK